MRRVVQAVSALASLYFAIHPAAIMDVYQLSLSEGVAVKDMGSAAFLAAVLALEARRRLEAECM